MDCIVSIHYKNSGFELEECDVHRKKRHAGDHEKELEYKVDLLVEEPITTTTTADSKVTCVTFVLFLFIFTNL